MYNLITLKLFLIFFIIAPGISFAQFQFLPILVDSGIYITDINVVSQDTIYVCGVSKMVKSMDGGNTWDTLIKPTTFYQADFYDNENGMAISPTGYVINTVNGGLVWDTIHHLTSSNIVYDIHMVDSATALVSADSGYIYKLNSMGYDVDTLVDLLAGGAPLIIKDFDFENHTQGFGGGITNGSSGLAKTTDGGNSWDIRATSGFLDLNFDEISFVDSSKIWGIEISPSPWEHISNSTDGGYYWNSGFPLFSTASVASIDFIPSGFGIVLMPLEIFFTVDSGITWNSLINIPPINTVYTKVKIVSDTLVYIGGMDAIYKILNPLSVSLIETPKGNNCNYSIYPNPVGNKIKIVSCNSKQFKNHQLTIKDMQGRLIQTYLTSGETTNIDLSSLTPGIYLICILSESSLYTQKIIKE